ncbi:MAG TPA: hypothetical protein VNA57_09155 [Acidimicrobiales bacterium]|nr:hypothetical protein [Acidimicrobiales bacterium]
MTRAMRQDLLALSDESLAALANRGIVRRSAREVGEGRGPTIVEAEDGAVTGVFPNGVEVVLAPGVTIEKARCSCLASGVCRHRVMAVLAYRDRSAEGTVESGAAPTPWSPACFSDEELEAFIGSRVLTIARKAHRAGYRARVRRATADDPVPTVELASCTVRFLVPGELGYARVDAARGTREDAVALAVWAFRSADAIDAGTTAPAVVDVAVGGDGSLAAAPTAGAREESSTVARATTGSGAEPALAVVADLLADGVVHTAGAVSTSILQARRALEARNLRWPIDALDEAADQLDAYRQRSARYRPEDVAGLLAEIVARHRCVVGHGASLRPAVLGTEEAAQTPLRLLRLTGLGARVWGDDSIRTVEVYLAHQEAGVVLALRRRAEVEEGDEPPSAEALGRRKAGGTRLSALAAGNVVTESALRAANRVVRITESRVARTTVVPSSGTWQRLPPGVLVEDLDAEAARLAGLPPAVVRPRVVAEEVRAVMVEEVEDVQYLAGQQRLVVAILAPVGRATVSLAHTSAAGGAIDALAEALAGTHGPVRFVAGHLRRGAGMVVIEPTAVVAGDTVVIPAFAPASHTAMALSSEIPKDPMAAAVESALSVSAEVPHRGWRHLPAGWARRAEDSANQLRRVGLAGAGTALADLCTATRASFGAGALDQWADSHLRLLVTAEQL